MWRGGFGSDPAVPAVVSGIQINCNGSKYGDGVESAPWSKITGRNAILDLKNGHWCWGCQASAINS